MEKQEQTTTPKKLVLKKSQEKKRRELKQQAQAHKEHVMKSFEKLLSEDEFTVGIHIQDLLEVYAYNLHEQDELNELIYTVKDKDEWQKMFKKRAARLGQLYEKNEEIVKEIKEILSAPISSNMALFLINELSVWFIIMGHYDTHCMIPFLDCMMPAFEKDNKLDWMLWCYDCFETLCTIHLFLPRETSDMKYKYCRRIMQLKGEYANVKNPTSRSSFFKAYHYFSTLAKEDGTVTLDESAANLREMLEFSESDLVQSLDSDSALIKWYTNETPMEWLLVADPYIDDASDETKDFYCKMAEELYEKEISESDITWRRDFRACIAYAHSRVLKKDTDWNEALKKCFYYYTDRMAHPEDEPYDEVMYTPGVSIPYSTMSFLISMPIVLERWCRKCYDRALVKEIMNRFIADTPMLYHYCANAELYYTSYLTEWCFTVLPYIDGAEAKEQWILDLVTNMHFPTHLHSAMVQKEAEAIARSILDSDPEFFADVQAEIGNDDIVDFISKCALFHDVGKNEISPIVNMQVRALDDVEFKTIRRHPYYGWQHFLSDYDFIRYRDVILGHHKSYNGKKGYPDDFDNTDSPYRKVIDLITICDCMDAATDSLGRNYKRVKTFDELLEELVQGAGTVYNPDIVAHIRGNAALCDTLTQIICNDRLETAYNIAKRHYAKEFCED